MHKIKENIKVSRYTFCLKFLSLFIVVFLSNSCAPKPAEKDPAAEISTALVAYAKVDKVAATTGDTITYQLNLNSAQGVIITAPDLKKSFDDFTISDQKKEKPKLIDNRLETAFVYKLIATKPGSYIINPVEVKYTIPKNLEAKYGKNGSAKTSKIYIEIKSVLKPEDKDKDIEDIKPLEAIPVYSSTLVIAIVAGVLIIAGLFFSWYRKPKKPEKILLPHEIAFNELERIKQEKLLESGEFKAFYFALSETLRRYLKNRYEISALEQVSDEVMAEVNKISEISSAEKEFLNAFLSRTDFYKFTDSASSQAEAGQLFQQTYNFVEQTVKIPEPVEAKKVEKK